MSTSKRVLIIGSYAPSLIDFRGALIGAIERSGHSVIAAAPGITPTIAKRLRNIGAEPRQIPLDNVSLNPLKLLQSYRAVMSIVREERPDVILAYTIKPVIAGALAGRAEDVPMIVSLITGVGYSFTGGRELKRVLSRAAASVLYRAALSRSHAVIFQNPDDERLFRRLRLVNADQRTEIVNGSGVDLSSFSPAPLPSVPSFLMISRLLRDKGIREFANAASRIKSVRPDARIILVGGLDPSPDSLRQRELAGLVQLGVEYRGHLSDVRPAIRDCSVYVLPSYREGTPRSVLEAMAMGRAIITTDAPGCRETVIRGENGLLVEPRDPESLFQAMMRFIEEPDLAARMGSASRRIAEAKYDVRCVNADMLRFCELS